MNDKKQIILGVATIIGIIGTVYAVVNPEVSGGASLGLGFLTFLLAGNTSQD